MPSKAQRTYGTKTHFTLNKGERGGGGEGNRRRKKNKKNKKKKTKY